MRLWHRNSLKLKKRDCGIKMRLVPYGAGWTDAYLDICRDLPYFIISNVIETSSAIFYGYCSICIPATATLKMRIASLNANSVFA